MKTIFNKLPQSFRKEEKELLEKGLNEWKSIMNLNDKEISILVTNRNCSYKNLKRLRCIALFICELNLSQEEAGLLMHSGIATIKSLASLMPNELVVRTNRLERITKTGRTPKINLERANKLINKAKEWGTAK